MQFLVKPVTEGEGRCRFADLPRVRPYTGAATVFMSHWQRPRPLSLAKVEQSELTKKYLSKKKQGMCKFECGIHYDILCLTRHAYGLSRSLLGRPVGRARGGGVRGGRYEQGRMVSWRFVEAEGVELRKDLDWGLMAFVGLGCLTTVPHFMSLKPCHTNRARAR